jgi:hypothetical protein
MKQDIIIGSCVRGCSATKVHSLRLFSKNPAFNQDSLRFEAGAQYDRACPLVAKENIHA